MRRVLFFLLLFISIPAMAEEPKGTRVSLSAQAEQLLPNDEVVVQFRIEAEGPKADLLRRKVNRISQKVSKRLAGEKDLVQRTIGRNMQPTWRYDTKAHRQVRYGWHLVQSEQVTSTDLDAVPEWVNAIEQAGAHLDTLGFRVSRQAQDVARKRLRMQAISEFRSRAAATAKALDASSFRILQLNTNASMPRYNPMLNTANAMLQSVKQVTLPALEAGRGRITVTVSGVILLPEKDYPVK